MNPHIDLFSQQSNALYKVAEIEISYFPKVRPSERPHARTSKEVYEILRSAWNHNNIEYCEEFKVLLLNQANRVLGIVDISTGGVASTIVDPKKVFGAVLKANATGIILAHNHPSGNLQPSEADKRITQRLKLAGELLEIKVLDHVILTLEGYYSFSDEEII
jgi:DNA repair protein RadC